MVRRHHAHQKQLKMAGQEKDKTEEDDSQRDDDSEVESDPDKDAEDLAAKLAAGNYVDNEDPNVDRVEMDREAGPRADGSGDVGEEDAAWARRSAEELVSAAGPAVPASDRQQVLGTGTATEGRKPGSGVLFNPKDYP